MRPGLSKLAAPSAALAILAGCTGAGEDIELTTDVAAVTVTCEAAMDNDHEPTSELNREDLHNLGMLIVDCAGKSVVSDIVIEGAVDDIEQEIVANHGYSEVELAGLEYQRRYLVGVEYVKGTELRSDIFIWNNVTEKVCEIVETRPDTSDTFQEELSGVEPPIYYPAPEEFEFDSNEVCWTRPLNEDATVLLHVNGPGTARLTSVREIS